jgi:hypothetical protein
MVRAKRNLQGRLLLQSKREPMKVACCSTAFDARLRSGDLTQLEWLDLCAHEVAVDGVAFDVRHFPRTDTDYLAQVKKMAADLGLSVAALVHGGFFAADEPRAERALEMALAIGAPLLAAPLPLEVSMPRTQLQEALSRAAGHAKRLNVTLALRNAPHTFAAGTHDLKRVAKEADSAWIRYAPDVFALEAGSEPEAIAAKAVLTWGSADADAAARERVVRLLGRYCGFLVLEGSGGEAGVPEMKNAVRNWRKALLEELLL